MARIASPNFLEIWRSGLRLLVPRQINSYKVDSVQCRVNCGKITIKNFFDEALADFRDGKPQNPLIEFQIGPDRGDRRALSFKIDQIIRPFRALFYRKRELLFLKPNLAVKNFSIGLGDNLVASRRTVSLSSFASFASTTIINSYFLNVSVFMLVYDLPLN